MSSTQSDHPSLNDPNAWVPYRYQPNLAAAAALTTLFGLATLAHCVLLVRRKTYYFTPFIIGGICKLPQLHKLIVVDP
jgi:hypothetical protein